MRTVDSTSLVAGLTLVGLGTMLLLDRLQTFDLSFGYLWPSLFAAIGVILLSAGLSRSNDE